MDIKLLWMVISGKFLASFNSKTQDSAMLIQANADFEGLMLETGITPKQKHVILAGLTELMKVNRKISYAMGISDGVSMLNGSGVSVEYCRRIADDILNEVKKLSEERL